jgi:hypothetical protein
MAIASILLTALASSVVWVSKALPSGSDPVVASLDSADIMQRFAEDLRYATTVTARTDKSITFTIPDQTGDGLAETISYSWSGVFNAPLVRTFNGSSINFIKKVKGWTLEYDVAAFDVPRDPIESAETSFYTPGLSVLTTVYPVRAAEWYGQVFKPAASGSATQYRITRVKIRTRSNGTTLGQFKVRAMRTTSTGVPGGTTLADATVNESALTSGFGWVDVAFTGSKPNPIADKVAIQFKHVSDTEACDVEASLLTISLSGAAWITTSNSGRTWSQETLKSGSLYVWGTYLTPQTPTKRYELLSVTSRLRDNAGNSDSDAVIVPCINRPDTP